LRQEGFQKGIGFGRELILKQLKKRFGYLSPTIERKLNESGVDVLDRFGESIFDFKNLEDAEKWWEDFEKGGNA
jgi:heme oxygenase